MPFRNHARWRFTSGLAQVFGPVLVVREFSDEEAAVAEANSTPYGTAPPPCLHRRSGPFVIPWFPEQPILVPTALESLPRRLLLNLSEAVTVNALAALEVPLPRISEPDKDPCGAQALPRQ